MLRSSVTEQPPTGALCTNCAEIECVQQYLLVIFSRFLHYCTRVIGDE